MTSRTPAHREGGEAATAASPPSRVAAPSLPCLSVDRSAPHPASAQLVDAVVDAVARGLLARGDRLPPVRTLAGELGLAPGTAAKAYKELEVRGAVETRGRAGTFVAASAEGCREEARQAARRFVDEVVGRLGFTPADAVEQVRLAAAARG
ncbi:GntR family transcriptional regulator [Micrococcus sp. NPDC078436]|uniref:GntR family transcriptional regulator n=1 Tax=Micrococcus sp. NPDC078436 TaxID=3154960 RepID=UPI00344CA744